MKKNNTFLAMCLCVLGATGTVNAQQSLDVTYTYKMGETTLGTKTIAETIGQAPAEQANVPDYVTANGFPATIEAGTTAYEIQTAYNNLLPFKVSADGAETYYAIAFPVNQYTYYWYADNSNNGKECWNANNTLLTATTQDNWKWSIQGDWLNGFTLKTQGGKYLSANDAVSATTLVDTPVEGKSYFILQRSGNNQFWRFNLKGNDKNLAHTSHGSLTISLYYASNNLDYVGAKIIFEEVGDFQTMMNELKAAGEAKEFLNMTHVGTPVAEATQRTELQAKIEEVGNMTFDNTTTYQNYKTVSDALNTKLDAYLTSTNLVMPESGKAYTLVFRPTDKVNGTYRYLNFNGTTLNTVAMANKESEIPASGVFVVRSWVDGSTTKYALVPAYGSVHGKYLTYQTVTDEWTPGANECVIDKLVGTTSGNVADKSAKNLFGCMYALFTNRTANDTKAGVYIMKMENGAFDNSTAPFLNDTYTSALIMKEVENYPSTVQLNAAANIDGIEAIATFSAPYAAIVPQGVTAHYVNNIGENAQTVALTEGEAIPAGQGVLLTGAEGPVVMEPATSETRATIEGNKLGNTAGGAKNLEYGKDYILTDGTEGVAFYPIAAGALNVKANKAYLHTEGLNAPSLVLSFGETDGVKGIESAKGQQTPVFDLQGRRVQKAVKGLYIQNGKKFMVK